MITRLIFALTTALTLTACGGGSGGGGGGSGEPIMNTNPIRTAAGGEPLNLSSGQIKAVVAQRVNAADTLLGTDIFTIDGSRVTSTSCSGAVCQASGLGVVTLSDFDTDATYEAVMTKNGVAVVQGVERATGDGTTAESLVWGGWLDHTGFLVGGVSDTDPGGYGEAVVYGLSLGNATGSVPVSGSATWHGIMVGYNFSREEGHQGDALLTADFAASNIDVAFTNVRDIETGTARSGFRFSDVPMSGTGFASHVGGRIEGAFYGPGHSETGGIFEHGNTIGAFGAKRQ